jgi:putative zinc finger/helix-turn-helix YgiT family protein
MSDVNMAKYVCDNCNVIEAANTRVEERTETYNVKGESITVPAKVRVCKTCGKDIFDESLDDLTLQAAYDVYRRKHKIISPSEIRALRELYGLSQRALGAVLDWGPITIHRYEAGSLPDESHNQVLRLLQDPFNMVRVFKENPDALDSDAYKKILDRLGTILSEKAPVKVAEVLGQSSRQKASVFTGFIDFDPDTLMEMMVFFAFRPGGVLKTKLNKLLWYADFLHYKHHTRSISGAAYSHYQLGPVPQNYETFLTALCANDALVVEEEDLGIDKEGETIVGLRVSANRKPQLSDIPQTASFVLEEVHKHFANMSSKRISNLSHKEEGYIATAHRQLISYVYADVLKVDPIARRRKTSRKKPATKGRKTKPISIEALKAALSRPSSSSRSRRGGTRKR